MRATSNFTSDIGHILDILVRQIQFILSIVILASFLAGSFSILVPKTYQATSTIGSIKTTTSVSFGSAIQLTTEEQLAAKSVMDPTVFYDRAARIQSYVTLIESAEVAQVVLDQVGYRLREDERSVARIIEMVRGNLREDTDLISISVTYGDPVLAAEIANVWAQAYVDIINRMYGSGVTAESIQAVEEQVIQAKIDYDQAQAALVDFTANNNIFEYTRQITDLEVIITNLRTARTTAVSTIINEQIGAEQAIIQDLYAAQQANILLALQQDQNLRRELIDSYMSALRQTRKDVFTENLNDRLAVLKRYYEDRRNLQSFLDNATSMRDAIQQGGEAAAQSNALALILLKTQVYASFQGTNNLQIQNLPEAFGEITSVDAAGMLADLSALIDTLTAREKDLGQLIDELSVELQNGNGLSYLDMSVAGGGGDLTQAIQEAYPALFEWGDLSDLGLGISEQGNPLEAEAAARSQDLLELKGLEDTLSLDFSQTPIELQLKDLEQQVRDLNAGISGESSIKQELERACELTWKTYESLATKKAELSVTRQSSGAEVFLASPSIISEKPRENVALLLGIVALIGFVIGCVITLCVEFWWAYKEIEPRPLLSITGWLKRFRKTK